MLKKKYAYRWGWGVVFLILPILLIGGIVGWILVGVQIICLIMQFLNSQLGE